MKNKTLLTIDRYTKSMYQAFEENGFKVVYPPKYMAEYDNTYEMFDSQIEENHVSYFFTFDFDIEIAERCYKKGVIYICWVFDSPHMTLHSKYADYPTNRIFVFDYDEYQQLINKGRKVYYLPLCTGVEQMHNTATSIVASDKYDNDVNLMASMYSSGAHSGYDSINYLSEYIKGYIEGLMETQQSLWGIDVFKSCMSKPAWDELKKYVKLDLRDYYDSDIYEIYLGRMMSEKVAQIERRKLCDMLSERFDFALFSGSDTSYNPKIVNKGYVNYTDEMPLVFYRAKININMNLHCITSGIPLRVVDILACEGFCLTNYQADIAQYFVDGEDLVIYQDFEDMFEKIEYYLEHEEERKRIAHSGYLKAKTQFDYSVGISRIAEVIDESEL